VQVIEAAAAVDRPACIDATFGLAVGEEVHCSACGKTTQQCSYTQYFYNTQVGRGLGGQGRQQSSACGMHKHRQRRLRSCRPAAHPLTPSMLHLSPC
jgi:hypothetical protein